MTALNKRVKTVKRSINLSLRVKERPLKQNGFNLSSESHSVLLFLERDVADCSTQTVLRMRSFSRGI